MVQMTRAALQTLIDSDIVENTAGAITATILNEILGDIIDSFDERPAGATIPSIRNFFIPGQSNFVDPGTTISGSQQFIFTVANSDNVEGTLTLRQDGTALATTVDPEAGVLIITVTSVTLAAGQQTVFRLEGVSTAGTGSVAFNRNFVITARSPSDFIYWGVDADGDITGVDVSTLNSAAFVGNQDIAVPTFTGNQHFFFLQRNSDPDPVEIDIDSLNQVGAFTKTANALTVNSVSYDSFISNQALDGAVISGQRVRLIRS